MGPPSLSSKDLDRFDRFSSHRCNTTLREDTRRTSRHVAWLQRECDIIALRDEMITLCEDADGQAELQLIAVFLLLV